MKKFIIYGLGRSGTTSLAAALANGKFNDKVVQEPFKATSGDVQRYKWLQEIQRELSFRRCPQESQCILPGGRHSIGSFLGRIYGRCVGIKHVFSSVPDDLINVPVINFLKAHDIKVIFLRRKKIIDAALSSNIALQHGFWGWKDGVREILDNFEYEALDCTALLHTAERMHNSVGVAEVALKKNISQDNLLSFYYEDLYAPNAAHRNKNFDIICEFLELKRSDLLESVVQWQFLNDNKQNKVSNLNRISNYEDILKLSELYPHLT